MKNRKIPESIKDYRADLHNSDYYQSLLEDRNMADILDYGFDSAIDLLVSMGFIDLAEKGMAVPCRGVGEYQYIRGCECFACLAREVLNKWENGK